MAEELAGFIAVNYKKNDKDTWIHFLTEIDPNCSYLAEMISPTAKVVYTSNFNAWYIEKNLGVTNSAIHGIETGKTIWMKHLGRQFSFCFYESKAFTGSIALLVAGTFGVYFYTGKFCYYKGITSLISSNMKTINEKLVSRLYFDATYYEKNSEFMGYDKLVSEISQIIMSSSSNTIYIIVDKLGLETLLIDVATTIIKWNLEELIHVDKKRFEIMSILGSSHLFTTNEKESRIYVRSSNFLKKKHEDKECYDLIFVKRKSEFCNSFECYQQMKGWHLFTFYSHSSHKDCSSMINFLKPEIIIPINTSFSNNISKNGETPNLLWKELSEIGDEEANKINTTKNPSEQSQFVNAEISLNKPNGQSLIAGNNLPLYATSMQCSSKTDSIENGSHQINQRSEIVKSSHSGEKCPVPYTNINTSFNIEEKHSDKFINLKLNIKNESKIFRQLLLFHIKHCKTKFKFKSRNNVINTTKKIKIFPSNVILRKLFLNSLNYGHVCLKSQDTHKSFKRKHVNSLGSPSKLVNIEEKISNGIAVFQRNDLNQFQNSDKSKSEKEEFLLKPTELKNYVHYLQSGEFKNSIDKFESKTALFITNNELSTESNENPYDVNKMTQSISQVSLKKNKNTVTERSSKNINSEVAVRRSRASALIKSPLLNCNTRFFFSPLKQSYLPAVFPNEFNGFEESAINDDIILFQYFINLLKKLTRSLNVKNY